MKKLKLKKGPRFTDRIRNNFINQTKRQMELTQEKRLKHFQLALSMVGISVNLMTAELIHAIAAKVDEKQEDFALKDATELADSIQLKYQMQMAGQQGSPVMGAKPPAMAGVPPHIQKMMDEGKIAMIPKNEKTMEILPEGPSDRPDDGSRPVPPTV